MGSYRAAIRDILLLTVLLYDVSYGSDWSYKGKTGPSHWHELFPSRCSGKLQSPINIDPEMTVYSPDLKDFAIWYDPPHQDAKMFVKNNGHAVQIDTVGSFFVTNGGLPNVYKTAQFHFHWGHKNGHGSEHHIAGQPHPLELHIVNFNYDKFGTIAEAVKEPQGLAVLGVLFEIVDEDNEVLKPILEAMEEVRDPDEEKLIEIKAVSLRDLLPSDISRYFRYNGSLTTPGCFESVVWTVFEVRQKISLDQLLEFRQVLKPKRHKHKKHSKRSAAEKNAKDVLREAGIEGDAMLEDELKSELMKDKMEAEMEPTTLPPPLGELDENSAKRAEENIARLMKEKKAEEKAAEEEHKKHVEKHSGGESEELTEYVQEILVNNFRPLQPINNRKIQRSFKLSTPQVVLANNPPQSPRYEVRDSPNSGRSAQSTSDNGVSRNAGLSVFVLISAAFLSLLVKS